MKKRVYIYGMAFIFGLFLITSTSSCKTKEGCGLEEKYKADMSQKRGDSNLFSKKQRKKMKKRN